jgi:hypothetical protein
MSDEGLKYPEWQGLLRDAILEFRPQELSTKVQKVETAIFEECKHCQVTATTTMSAWRLLTHLLPYGY